MKIIIRYHKLRWVVVCAWAMFCLLAFCSCIDDDDDAMDDDTADDDVADDDAVDDDAIDDDVADDDQADDDAIDDDTDDYAPPPSNDIGVFVSAQTGDDAYAGTMESPKQTIGAATVIAQGKVVFVAEGVYEEAVETQASLFGGYRASDWSRDIALFTTRIETPENAGFTVSAAGRAPVVIEGFTIQGANDSNYQMYGNPAVSIGILVEQGPVIVARNTVRGGATVDLGGFAGASSVAVAKAGGGRLDLEDNDLHGGASTGVLGNQSMGLAIVGDGSTVVAKGNRIHSGYATGIALDSAGAYGVYAAGQNSTVTLTANDIRTQNSTVNVGETAAILNYGNKKLTAIANFLYGGDATYSQAVCSWGPIELAHNTLVAEGTMNTYAALLRDTSLLVNNVLVSGALPAIVRLETSGAEVTLAGNDFFSIGGEAPLVRGDGFTVEDLAALHECAWSGCTAATGNLREDPAFAGDEDFHLTAGSLCVDAGVDPYDWLSHAALPFDIDGEPRPQGGGWDIGADET